MKNKLMEFGGAAIVTLFIVLMVMLWDAEGQDAPKQTAPAPTPAVEKLTNEQELKFLNLLQRAILKTVDVNNAQQAQKQAIEEFSAYQNELRAMHKWPEGTAFEPVDDQKHVMVHVPAAAPAKSSEVPKGEANDQKKEKH